MENNEDLSGGTEWIQKIVVVGKKLINVFIKIYKISLVIKKVTFSYHVIENMQVNN